MRLEGTQVHEAGGPFKLAVVGLAAACRTIQLVDARDGSPRPASNVIDPVFRSANNRRSVLIQRGGQETPIERLARTAGSL
jgi:hypothetical protein